jgi:hypothetical protein
MGASPGGRTHGSAPTKDTLLSQAIRSPVRPARRPAGLNRTRAITKVFFCYGNLYNPPAPLEKRGELEEIAGIVPLWKRGFGNHQMEGIYGKRYNFQDFAAVPWHNLDLP